MTGSQIQDTWISCTQTSCTQTSCTQISGTQISGTQISGTQISGTQISGTQISGTQISYTSLTCAQITGAQISGVQICRQILHGLISSRYNRWPYQSPSLTLHAEVTAKSWPQESKQGLCVYRQTRDPANIQVIYIVCRYILYSY